MALVSFSSSPASSSVAMSPRASSSSVSSPPICTASAFHHLHLLRQPSPFPSSYSNPSPYSMPSSADDDSIIPPLTLQNSGSDGRNNDGTTRWMTMARTTGNDGSASGGGGVFSMLQKAFCSNFFASSPSANYQSVLTRDSMDSGLELDELEKNRRDEKRNCVKRRGQTKEKEEEEKMLEKRENKSEEGQTEESEGITADGESAEMERVAENKKRRSVGRLLSLFLFPSANSSPTPSSMFDFPTSPNGASFALSSPVAQLSHSNAILVQENERLDDRVRELELTLRDHVAHINSIYHSLHTLHGFHALQLPDGALVHLSQFHGFPLRFICKTPAEHETVEADEDDRIIHELTNNRHTVGQARRFMLQQRQKRRQQQHGSVNECQSLSSASGSSSSFASSSSTTFDSSLAADPTDLSQAMMRRLCIRPVAGDDSEEMQAFMEWLKSGGTAGGENVGNDGGTSAAFSPSADGESKNVENVTIGGNGNAEVSNANRSQRQPPVYSVISKSQRIRSQCPSLSSRRRSPLLSSASSASSAPFLVSPTSPSYASHNHRGGFGGGGGALSADETAAARSPRRSGIGITNMSRMGSSRPSDAQKTAKRHLI